MSTIIKFMPSTTSPSGGKGQIVALIGSNGAGKSTLLNSIAGVKEVKSGDIVYMDQSMLRMDAEARVKRRYPGSGRAPDFP